MIKKYSELKKADFGADFSNTQDFHPSPSNVAPGDKGEIVKQQTDMYPMKTSEDESDNGEYVHTHPEHCPRPDLRKLKIVDPDRRESESRD